MFRLSIKYSEGEQAKEVHSLWYVSKEDALRQGKQNLKGLYAQKCLENGKGKMYMECKAKRNAETYFIEWK